MSASEISTPASSLLSAWPPRFQRSVNTLCDYHQIYHIVHVDRLPHIITAGYLYSDAYMQALQGTGTTIGMPGIKERRLTLELSSHPGLHGGDCVPFYFSPRSIMLYLYTKIIILR